MRRQDKYPDTETFRYYNANPRHRITGDCVMRAVSFATGLNYNDVVMGMAKVQCDTGYDPTMEKGLELYMDSIGWVKHKQPRKFDNTKFTGEEFCRKISSIHKGNIVANIGGHHMVAICPVDNIGTYKVHDIWNSTDGCIGNYWTRKGE